MPGHNHHSGCICGWCLKYGGAKTTKPLYSSVVSTSAFTSYASFTIPNASCPVCGASVFFYQSPAGGRVFFDELGPPWPKHPCTDNPTLPVVHSARVSSRSGEPIWRRDGWEPIRIRSSRSQGSWNLIPVQNLLTGLFYDALCDMPLRLQGEVCAFMKPWDANGWSAISFVELDGRVQAILIPVFEKRRFVGVSRTAAIKQRSRMGA